MSVHIILGEDRYLIESTIQQLCQQVGLQRDDFGVEKYSLLEYRLQDVLQDAQTTSLFAQTKVILALDAYFLTSKRMKQTFEGEHNLQVLDQYLQHPNPLTQLVFIVPNEKFDERKKIVKLLKQKAIIHLAQPFNDKQLMQWLDTQLQGRMMQFDAMSKQELLRRCDFQLEMLANELEKYQLYGKSTGYQLEDVELLTPDNLQSDIFQFIDALLLKKFFLAQQQLGKYLDEGEDVFGVIALVSGQLKLILQAKALQDAGLSPQSIASRLNIHPYRVKLALEKVRKHNPQLIIQTISALLQLDYQIKQGNIDKNIGFDLLIIKFCT